MNNLLNDRKSYICFILMALIEPALRYIDIDLDPEVIRQIQIALAGLGGVSMRHAVQKAEKAATDPIAEMKKKRDKS